MNWVRAHRGDILSIAAASTVGLILLGFGLMFWQLDRVQSALRGNGMYEIQRDSRELVEKSLAIPGFTEYLERTDPAEYTGEDQQRFETQVHVLIDFYLSVFRQDRMDALTKGFARTFAAEFCNFFKAAPVQSYWKRKQSVGEFRGEHNRMRRVWCKHEGV